MKIDRLIGILSTLLQKEKVTAPYLANKFEVSRRTINRDIEDLCQAGIPIVTTRGKTGGISIMEGYVIDKTLLTSSDMQAVLAGLKGLDSVFKTNRYKQLMDKLSPDSSSVLASDEHILIDLSSWHKSYLTPKIELIKKAIDLSLQIKFTYYSPKGETQRIIEPYLLIFQWSSWYIYGYCTLRKKTRMFKLNRIENLEITENAFNMPLELCDFSFRDFSQPKSPVTASVRFDKKIKWRIIDEFGINNIKETKKGLIFTFNWYDKTSLFSWLLSVGNSAELMEPASLRKDFLKLIEKISDKYK